MRHTISFPELSSQSIAGLRPAFAQTLAGLKWILHVTERIFPYDSDDSGVTVASARIVAAVRAHSVWGVE